MPAYRKPALRVLGPLVTVLAAMLRAVLTRCAVPVTGTIEHYYAKDHPAVFVKISPSLFHLLGLVISFFSVFRNSISYGRFWEVWRRLVLPYAC